MRERGGVAGGVGERAPAIGQAVGADADTVGGALPVQHGVAKHQCRAAGAGDVAGVDRCGANGQRQCGRAGNGGGLAHGDRGGDDIARVERAAQGATGARDDDGADGRRGGVDGDHRRRAGAPVVARKVGVAVRRNRDAGRRGAVGRRGEDARTRQSGATDRAQGASGDGDVAGVKAVQRVFRERERDGGRLARFKAGHVAGDGKRGRGGVHQIAVDQHLRHANRTVVNHIAVAPVGHRSHLGPAGYAHHIAGIAIHHQLVARLGRGKGVAAIGPPQSSTGATVDAVHATHVQHIFVGDR